MIAAVVAIVVALGAFGALSYQSLVAWKSSEVASLVQRNAARMSEVATVARASLFVDDSGLPRAPLGTAGDDGRLHLPASAVGPDLTPWGGRYAWCPLALPPAPGTAAPAGDAAAVPSGGGAAYPATTVAGVRFGAPSAPYVVSVGPGAPPAGDPAAQVVGYVVSPAPYATTAPSCADVVVRGAVAVVVPSAGPAGTAWPVEARGSLLSAAAELTAAASDLRASVAPVAAGDGSGADPADPMSLADAAALWARVLPRSAVLTLAPGRYPVDGLGAGFARGMPARAVRLSSATPGAAVLVGSATVAFDGDAALAGVATDTGVTVATLPGARLSVTSSSLSRLDVDGGEATVDGNSNVGLLRAVSGRVSVEAGAGSVASFEGGDGDLVAMGAAVAPTGAASLLGSGRVTLVGRGSLGGSSAPTSAPTAACDEPRADGSVACRAACDPVHPRLKAPSCGGDGVTLASLSVAPGAGGDALTCTFRPWAPLIQRRVATPDGGTTTALDAAQGAPAPAPAVGATCSMAP